MKIKKFKLKGSEIEIAVSDYFTPYFSLQNAYFSNLDFMITVNEKIGEGFAFTLTAPVNGNGEHCINTTLKSGNQELTSRSPITKDEAQKIINSLKIDDSEPLKKLLMTYLWLPVSPAVLTKSKSKPKAIADQLDMFEEV